MILKLIKKQQQQNNHDSQAIMTPWYRGQNQLLLPIKQEGIENSFIIHIV